MEDEVTARDTQRDDAAALHEELEHVRNSEAELKQTSEMVQKKDVYFHAYQYSPLGFAITSFRAGLFLEVNERFCRLSGFSRRELIGKSIFDRDIGLWADPADGFRLRQMLSQEGEVHDFEFRYRRKSGEIHWGMLSAVIVEIAGERCILSHTIDISERKRAEDSLRESEARYRGIITNITDVYYRTDKDGRLIMMSPSGSALLGYDDMVNFLGENVADHFYYHPEDRNKLKAVLYARGSVTDYEVTLRHRDGTSIPVSTSSRVYRDEQGEIRGVEGTFRDIRERKGIEEALRQREAMLQSIFRATPVGLCIMKDRVYQSANKTWCENFGYSEDELIGNTTRVLYENDEEFTRVGGELYSGLAERGLASVQTRLRRKDGTFRDVILTAAPLQSGDLTPGTVVAIEDVTDRKRALEELEENRRQLANIIDFLPDATFVIDRESKVIAWNRAMEEMTGVRAEEMLGKGDHEYAVPFCGKRRPLLIDLALHPDPETEKHYTTLQRKGDSIFGESYTPGFASGNRHLSATASVLRDSRGVVVAAIECIRNNTERKRLEERLQRAEKMESLGLLAGGVAHDLNNILGVMMGYSELMLAALAENNPLREHVGHVIKSSERAAAIIQDMLTLARRGVVTRGISNLNAVIVDQLRTPEYTKLIFHHPRVRVHADLEKDLLNIKGSPVHLAKTLMNLLANAVEAIHGDGMVTVRTENRYLDRPVNGYDHVSTGDYAVLSVSDTGEGISRDDMKRIFEPFYTKKVMGRSGTGLGLSVVWGVVKDHDGYIDVQSRPGAGTIFTLYFPVTREALPETVHVAPATYAGKGETVLVVDDIEEQRELASRMLTKLNYRTEAVAGGEEAVAYLSRAAADLVLLDMIMDPGIDGLETYRQIVAIRPGQKAVIVSGFAETERVKQAQALGAGPFVRKPYVLEKIGLAIREELDRK